MTKIVENDYEKQLQRTYERYMRDEITPEDIPPGMLFAINRMIKEERQETEQIIKEMEKLLRKAKDSIGRKNKIEEENFEEPFDSVKFKQELNEAFEAEAKREGSNIVKRDEHDNILDVTVITTYDNASGSFNMALFDE